MPALQTLALILLFATALPAATNHWRAPASKEPPLRVLRDGRVVDFRGLMQLDDIVASWGRAPDDAVRARQRALWQKADTRYRVTGTVEAIADAGVYVRRVRGMVLSGGELTPVTTQVYVAGYPAAKLVDGDSIDTWVYPIGPHRFENTYHNTVTVAGFDYGTPFTGNTNDLPSIVRLLPAGETDIPVKKRAP